MRKTTIVGFILIVAGVFLLAVPFVAPFSTITYETRSDGYFTINSVNATPSTHLNVDDPKLKFSFVATENGKVIKEVWIFVWKNNTKIDEFTLAESTMATVWTGSYNLPSEGTYEIQGYVFDHEKRAERGQGFRKMSITASYSSGEVTVSGKESYQFLLKKQTVLIAGFFVIGLGFVFTVPEIRERWIK